MKTPKINKFILIGLILLSLIFCIIPASAEILDKEYTDRIATYNSYAYSSSGSTLWSSQSMQIHFVNSDWSSYEGLYYIAGTITGSTGYFTFSGDDITDNIPITLQYGGVTYGDGLFFARRHTDILGTQTSLDYWILVDSFDVAAIIDDTVPPSSNFDIVGISITSKGNSNSISVSDIVGDSNYYLITASGKIPISTTGIETYMATNAEWQTTLSSDYDYYQVNILNINSNLRTNVSIYDESDALITYSYDSGSRDLYFVQLPVKIKTESPSPFSKIYWDNIGDTAGSNSINVLTHVYSTADKSLIGGTTVTYNATDGSDNVTKTLSTGEGIFALQKYQEYTVFASAEGYIPQSSVNEVSIFTGDTQNAIYLTPVGNVSAGNGAINFQVFSYTETGSVYPLQDAVIEIDGKTLITNSAGHSRYEVSKNETISYRVYKDGFVTYSRTFTPGWSTDAIDEYVYLRPVGLVLPGEPTAEPTPDIRTSNEKAESAFNIILDNIEAIATLSVIVVILSLFEMISGGGRKR